MIAFVTEASRAIGFGHLYRSIALAQEAQKRDRKTCFYINSIQEKELVKKFLPGIDLLPQGDLLENTDKEDYEAIFVDVYHKHFKRFRALEETKVNLVTIVDAAFSENALKKDYLFKIGFQDFRAKTETIQTSTGLTKAFSGTDFFIFREEFSKNPHHNFRKKVSSVLVSMGGSDPSRLTELALGALEHFEDSLNIAVVAGSGFSANRVDTIRQFGKNQHKITLHQNVTNMAEIMAKTDLAIINGGNTRFELSALGVPFISIAINEKQNEISNAVQKAGIGWNLGVYHELREEEIRRSFKRFSSDWEERERMSGRMKELVVPKGAERIFRILEAQGAI